MDQIWKRKLKEIATHSQVRDLTFHLLTWFLIVWHKWPIVLQMPKRTMKWASLHSKSSCSNLIKFKLKLQTVKMLVKVNHPSEGFIALTLAETLSMCLIQLKQQIMKFPFGSNLKSLFSGTIILNHGSMNEKDIFMSISSKG